MNKVTAMTSPISSSRDPPENALKKPMPMSMPLINHGIARLIISNTESWILTADAELLMLYVSRLDGYPCAQERTGSNGGGAHAIYAARLSTGCGRVSAANGLRRGQYQQRNDQCGGCECNHSRRELGRQPDGEFPGQEVRGGLHDPVSKDQGHAGGDSDQLRGQDQDRDVGQQRAGRHVRQHLADELCGAGRPVT